MKYYLGESTSFHRITRTIRPPNACFAYLPHSHSVKSKFQNLVSGNAGELRVMILVGLASQWLLHVVGASYEVWNAIVYEIGSRGALSD